MSFLQAVVAVVVLIVGVGIVPLVIDYYLKRKKGPDASAGSCPFLIMSEGACEKLRVEVIDLTPIYTTRCVAEWRKCPVYKAFATPTRRIYIK